MFISISYIHSCSSPVCIKPTNSHSLFVLQPFQTNSSSIKLRPFYIVLNGMRIILNSRPFTVRGRGVANACSWADSPWACVSADSPPLMCWEDRGGGGWNHRLFTIWEEHTRADEATVPLSEYWIIPGLGHFSHNNEPYAKIRERADNQWPKFTNHI